MFNKFLKIFALSALAVFPLIAASNPSLYHWNGFYVGALAGGVISQFDANTYTQDPLIEPTLANLINTVGKQTIVASGFITGIEGGYNWQIDRLLIGLHTDIQSLSINGEKNSGAIAYPNQLINQFVMTSYGNSNWLLTIRPRIGFATNQWLFYLTGGLALNFLQSDFIFSNNLGEFESKRIRQVKPGYDIGAGIETGLTSHISLKAEYLFTGYGTTQASIMNGGDALASSLKLKMNLWRLGLDYHFNKLSAEDTSALQSIQSLFHACLWKTEIGTYLFLSSGTDGSPQPLLFEEGMPLISRLTFSGLSAISAETFVRTDHERGLFIKGFLGAGSVTSGQLNDEDFPAGGAYSNTLSATLGNLSYATLDLGYSFLKSADAKTGVFIGYNYNAQNLNVYGCNQLAGASVCVPSTKLKNFLGISEDDSFNSLRVGLTTLFKLSNQLRLISEVAYLPFVNFIGTDMHNARQLIGPEHANVGNGVMVEAILDYQFLPSWRVGLGGRYWTWNMHRGYVTFDFLGEDEPSSQPARFTAQRYGAFLKLSYSDDELQPSLVWGAPINWQGVFVGAQLGGAWEKSYWSDPYGSSAASENSWNVAGFGDRINASGPMGGVNVNVNWQRDQWVYGLGASLNVADIRGENTLFSGLGGVNGQVTANYVGTIVGRLGLAWDASLIYVNLGGAFQQAKYNINANTAVLTLGSESKKVGVWGWVGGIGVEHALSPCWTTSVEYDYAGLSSDISFPFIDNQAFSVKKRMNIFKVGLNYKLINF